MSNLFQKLNHEADVNGIDRQQFQKLFYLEHFLKQVSESEYKQDFLLKGGYELASLLGWNRRTTQDLDATLSNHTLDSLHTTEVLNNIFSDSTDDVQFTVKGSSEIMEGNQYPGLRFKLGLKYKTATDSIHIDISTGDVISPAPITLQHHIIMGDGTAFSILAYPLEQIVSDKLITTLLRGPGNTRSKDYLDLYFLEQLEGSNIDLNKLQVAFIKTANQKGLPPLSLQEFKNRLQLLAQDPSVRSSWNRYQAQHDYATGISLEDTLNAAARMLDLVSQALEKRHISLN